MTKNNKKEYDAKVVSIGNSYGVILSKEVLGRDFEIKKGSEVKISRGKNFIKIYPVDTVQEVS